MSDERRVCTARTGEYSTPVATLIVKERSVVVRLPDRKEVEWHFDPSGKMERFSVGNVQMVVTPAPAPTKEALAAEACVLACSHIVPSFSGHIFTTADGAPVYVCSACYRGGSSDFPIMYSQEIFDREVLPNCTVVKLTAEEANRVHLGEPAEEAAQPAGTR